MFQLNNLLKSPIGWLNADQKEGPYFISSRVRLARNLSNARFPHAAAAKELQAVRRQIFEAAQQIKKWQSAAFIHLADLDAIDRRFLVERHLISADLIEYPQERAVVVGPKELTSLMINEEDHLRLQVIFPSFGILEALQEALDIDEQLGKYLNYAYRNDFGFLTTCPTNVGTGLRVSCLVHLPGLVQTNSIAAMLQELSRAGLATRGFYGEGSKAYGDLFQISNAATIGKSEYEYAETMAGILKTMLNHETAMRAKLFKGAHKPRVTDRIWRAYGILTHARLISYEEAMREISWLRLGLAVDLKIDNLALAKLNELILITQPAHIQLLAEQELSAPKRDAFRAELIRKNLKKS